tara:strand:- start:8097 stop:9266 length:1170 start_codon:yes stop_codon:yes gene_type:complete
VDKVKFLDLGMQPIANRFLTSSQIDNEFLYNLSVGFDQESCLVTNMDYVKPALMFNRDYAYRGSMSKTMRDHFLATSNILKKHLQYNPKVLEIGSNDGVFLKNWNPFHTFAVEPCGNFANETNSMGYKTYCKFWDKELSEEILQDTGPLDLVFAANCICHMPDLDSAFSAVANILNKDGLFVFEDPSLASMVNINSYDQIYDEHAHVFSVTALQNILNRHNLSIVKVDNLDVHGGSNRIWATLNTTNIDNSVNDSIEFEKIIGLHRYSTFVEFANRVHNSKESLLRILRNCKTYNKKVISYGATSKSTTVFNYCGIGPDLIEYITDTTPEKQNKYSPGMHIPIVSPEEGFDESVDFAFLGAWNFAKEIKNKEQNFGGKFITHVPTVRFI